MKKTLLICLLGYLCFPTSTLTAQVADSPGADFLHRSQPQVSFGLGDTHRGGETRSDTLPEKYGLVDHSGQGQEGESSSASRDIQENPMLFYLQVKSDIPLNNLRITFLEGVIDTGTAMPRLYEATEQFQPGSMWDGGFGAEWVRLRIPSKQAGLLSMYLDESRIINEYLVFPGDSIKMFIDLQKGEKVFAGPGYALFELQEQAEKLLARITREEGMKLHVRKGKNLFGSEERLGEFEKSQLDFGAKARLVPIDVPEMLKAWEVATTDPVYFRELGHLLSYYEGIITPEILAYLKSELQSAFYIKQTGRLQTLLGYAKSEQERDLIRETFMEILPTYDVGLKTSGLLPPPEKQIALRYRILKLQAKLENQRIGELILNYPDGDFRDFILGKHISQMVKMGTESPEELEALAAQVVNPTLRHQVQELVGAIQPESKITDFVFKDEDGKVYSLSDFEGKTLLVNTYFTGCSASSTYYKNVLSKIEQELGGHGDLVLISLSADREAGIWEKGNTSGLYNSNNWLRLNTGDAGYSHPFFRNYLISSAPRPILIGPDGRLISVTQLYADPDHLRDLLVRSISQKPISHVQ